MLNNKGIKDIQSLRDKKSRDASGLFVAEGPKIVAELLAAAPGQLVALYALEGWVQEQGSAISGSPVEIVDAAMLHRLSHLQTPNSVLAVFRMFPATRPSAAKDWCLYLDTIQDPGNLGTIIRLADWFAVPHVVCSAGCADAYNPKVVQSTMASLARVNIWYDGTENWLQEQQAPLWAAALDGTSLYRTTAASPGVLMIGNESKGLRKEYLAMATQKITIPRRGGAESLNAAVATGIILSHLMGDNN
jgi:TrmH family RNA methyltransferase